VAHYKAALALNPDDKGKAALSESLRARAMAALTEKKDPALAVRWAREGVGANDSDATHALLADMLYAAGEYESSVAEYKTALQGSPDDTALKRGLDRARKKAGVAKAPRARSGGKGRAAKAGASEAAGESPEGQGDSGEKAAPPSAPAEPAADEQK
jgi:tetratricopeptide (TPR) repeat protein